MRVILISVVVGFCLFCGFLVIESGVLENIQTTELTPCILLQQTTTTGEPETANPSVNQNAQLQAASQIAFRADNAPPKSITLGSTDPKSGFKFSLKLTSKGAAIEQATLSEYDDRNYKNLQPLVILSPVKFPGGSQILSMANRELVFVDHGLLLRLSELHWKSSDVEKAADGSQTAQFETIIKNTTNQPILKITKLYKLTPGSYHLDCILTLENLTDSTLNSRFNLTGPVGIPREALRADARKVVGGFLDSDGQVISARKDLVVPFPMNVITKQMGLKTATEHYQQAQKLGDQAELNKAVADLQIGSNLPNGQKNALFLWAATTNKYFTAILRPVPAEGAAYCDWVKDRMGWYYNPDNDKRGDSGDETVGLDLKIAASDLNAAGQPGSTKTYSFQLYLGPKDKTLFDKNQLYKNLGYFHTIDFMPCCCCPEKIIYPLAFGILALMKWMYGFIHNYGIVIIIFVFLVRLCLYPLTKKSQVSMSKMSKLAPKAEEIKKKYADNKAEMNKQMMALYKEHGASPVMGMLPMFAQMPIWIALYSAIYASIELRGAVFLPFWITDLSAPDALFRFPAVTLPLFGQLDSFNLLPILMGVAFYLQQKMMPSQATAVTNPQMAQQQKIMMIMMPILFPLMLYKAPSGLNLYIMSSVFAGVVEQHVIRKHIKEKEEQESKGLVAVTKKTGGKVKKKKPKPFFRY